MHTYMNEVITLRNGDDWRGRQNGAAGPYFLTFLWIYSALTMGYSLAYPYYHGGVGQVSLLIGQLVSDQVSDS